MFVSHLQLVDSLPDGFDAAVQPHGFRGDVGVASGAVPVAGNGLRVERRHHAKVLADAVEEETRHPEMVADLDALARADLVFPLGRHHFRVGAADFHAGVEAGLVVVVVVLLLLLVVVGILIIRLTQFNCYCNCLLELSLAKD